MRKPFASVWAVIGLFGIAGFLATSASAFQVQVGTAPESNLPLILGAIRSANQSLLVNIYELSSPEIAQAFIDQINRGVHVEILQEGEPVGGIAAAARGLHARIAQAMEAHPQSGDRYVEMHRDASGRRRFRFDHAKYIVIDQVRMILGSENYSPGGQPEPGTEGNRGWEVYVNDPTPAQWFAKLFASDSDPSNSDIQNLLTSSMSGKSTLWMHAPSAASVIRLVSTGSNPVYEASDGQILTSPDTSETGLVNLIKSARSTLDIEEMSFALNWRGAGAAASTAPSQLSPMADAILTVARRGVHVRILLNDEHAFAGGTQGGGEQQLLATDPSNNSGTTQNRMTIAALLQEARKEKLPLDARIANLQAMHVSYIHNKGVVVDRKNTLISSINWTQNSVTNNRESGFILSSPQIAAFYEQAFESDWNRSAGQTIQMMASSPRSNLTELPDDSALTTPSDQDLDCPNKVQVTVKVGAIESSQATDPSYSELQGKELSAVFVRDQHGEGKRCILLGPDNSVIELRNTGAQHYLSCDLENYTSTYKPYSILALIPHGVSLEKPGATLSTPAQVLEGTTSGGGRRRRLGDAWISLTTQN